MPSAGGSRLLRACGTHFIGHKVAALKRLVDRLGVCITHPRSLTEAPSTKPAKTAVRLRGYIRQGTAQLRILSRSAHSSIGSLQIPSLKRCGHHLYHRSSAQDQ
eukprot:scpid100537/ scgid9883/ 